MMRTAIATIALLAFLGGPETASAEVPHQLPVVGLLNDATDQPLDGDYDVTFSLYPSESGGSSVWSETYDAAHPEGQLSFTSGRFAVYLGSDDSNPLELDALVTPDEMWLGISVGTADELSRLRVASVPWALEAEVCAQVGELMPEDIQPLIGADACSESNQFMRGWDGSSAQCAEPTLPADALDITDVGVTVQAPIDTTIPCIHGIAEIAPDGTTVCAETDVTELCTDGQVLASDGLCHAVVPTGGIILWSGDETSIPEGWALCNGDTVNGITTPDLRGRFVVGYDSASSSYADAGDLSGGGTSAGSIGGSETVTLSTDELPSHGHGVADPGHGHLYADRHIDDSEQVESGSGDWVAENWWLQTQRTSADNTTGITVEPAGGDGAHENRPPYYVLAFIMRVQ